MNIFSSLWELIKNLLGVSTTTTTTGTVTTTTTTKQVDQTKKALCVGINTYPNPQNNLRGCVNDAKAWKALLKEVYGFAAVTIILNSKATYRNVKNALVKMVDEAVTGDVLVFTVSSHGTSIADYNNDEPDGRDEAICLYDKLLVDDDIREILANLNPDATMIFISDSCHSGTVTRRFIRNLRSEDTDSPTPRYMPPRINKRAESLGTLKVHNKVFYPQDGMKEILLSGCKSDEYSYDAYFGKPMGAFTHHATELLRRRPDLTYNEFYVNLRTKLPSSRYPQTPQLEGKTSNLKKKLFS